jgi:hypothetical protein
MKPIVLSLLAGLVANSVHAGLLEVNVKPADPNTALDVRIDAVQLQGVKSVLDLKGAPRLHVESGRTIGIACKWSAHLVGNWTYWQTDVARDFRFVIKIDDATIATGPAILPAGTRLGSKTKDTGGWQVPTPSDPSPYHGSSETTNYSKQFAGSTSPVQWTAEKPGQHVVRCEILGAGLKEATVGNNFKGQYLFVDVPVAQAGSAAGLAAAGPPQPFAGKLSPPLTANRSEQKAENRVAAGPASPVRVAPPPVPAGSFGGPVPQPVQSRLASNSSPSSALPAVQKPAAASAARELIAVSCSAGLGGLRFNCATRAGFERCEALRAQRQVEHCALNERR